MNQQSGPPNTRVVWAAMALPFVALLAIFGSFGTWFTATAKMHQGGGLLGSLEGMLSHFRAHVTWSGTGHVDIQLSHQAQITAPIESINAGFYTAGLALLAAIIGLLCGLRRLPAAAGWVVLMASVAIIGICLYAWHEADQQVDSLAHKIPALANLLTVSGSPGVGLILVLVGAAIMGVLGLVTALKK